MYNKVIGFTVVEMLVASSIFLLALGIVSQSLISGGQATNRIAIESDLVEDARAMGNMVTDQITQALYVYPPGVQLELSTSGEVTTLRPGSSSSLWTVGTDPIIAFLERPTDINAPCSSSQPEGCVFFSAYYPVERSLVTQTTAPYPYLADGSNTTAWVLFEYRKRLDITYIGLASNSASAPVGNALVGEVGNIMADYLVKDSFIVSFDRCNDEQGFVNDSNNDSVPDCNGLDTASMIYASVVNGSFKFEQARKQRGSFKGINLEFVIAPRNLFNPAVSN